MNKVTIELIDTEVEELFSHLVEQLDTNLADGYTLEEPCFRAKVKLYKELKVTCGNIADERAQSEAARNRYRKGLPV